MKKFRKRPVVIEAIRIDADTFDGPHPNPKHIKGVEYDPVGRVAIIKTLEGTMTGSVGDWIIRGVKGELYPCKHDIFEATYEPFEEKEQEPEYDPAEVVKVYDQTEAGAPGGDVNWKMTAEARRKTSEILRKRVTELERTLAIRDGADVCESCGILLKPEDPRHNWVDGIVTCMKCGGPEAGAKPCDG